MLSTAETDKVQAAIVAAHKELPSATKDTVGQVGRSPYKYADLAAVVDAYRAVYAKHGLAIIQGCMPTEPGMVRVQSTILHESGQWIADEGLTLPAPKNDPQGFGSALTYARRYGLSALAGIVTDDDDGQSAVNAISQVSQAFDAKPVPAPVNQSSTKPATTGPVMPYGRSKGLTPFEAATEDLEYMLPKIDVNHEKFAASNQVLAAAIQSELDRRAL